MNKHLEINVDFNYLGFKSGWSFQSISSYGRSSIRISIALRFTRTNFTSHSCKRLWSSPWPPPSPSLYIHIHYPYTFTHISPYPLNSPGLPPNQFPRPTPDVVPASFHSQIPVQRRPKIDNPVPSPSPLPPPPPSLLPPHLGVLLMGGRTNHPSSPPPGRTTG